MKDCILKVQTLKYGEESCYNGILIIKALSSGVEFGSCNWILSGPKGDVGYISCSSFNSAHAMDFDFRSLRGTRTLIYSDFSSLSVTQDVEDGSGSSKPSVNESLFVRYEFCLSKCLFGKSQNCGFRSLFLQAKTKLLTYLSRKS